MRVVRFIKALWKYIRYGKRVDFNVYVERLYECSKCDCLNKENWTCKSCGCYVDKKAKMSTENCPNDIWKKQE